MKDDIRQHWLDYGLKSAAELMACSVQIGLDYEMREVMDICQKLVDRGAKGGGK